MGQPEAEPALDRAMLVFTDESGAVVLIEDALARLMGYDDPDDAVGDSLAAALGMPAKEAQALLNEISARGSGRHRLAQIRNRQAGRSWWVLLGGSALVAEGRFLGADITVTPATAHQPADDLDHRDNLQRMAALVRSRMRNGGSPAISEEQELELKSYFAARMLALYILIVRMGGHALGEALEQKVRRLNQARGWPMEMRSGRLTFGEAGLLPQACQEVSHAALAYAVDVTSKRLVAKELGQLDVNFSSPTIQRATQYGIRTDV